MMHHATMDPFDVLRTRLTGTDRVPDANLALVIEGGGMRDTARATLSRLGFDLPSADLTHS